VRQGAATVPAEGAAVQTDNRPLGAEAEAPEPDVGVADSFVNKGVPRRAAVPGGDLRFKKDPGHQDSAAEGGRAAGQDAEVHDRAPRDLSKDGLGLGEVRKARLVAGEREKTERPDSAAHFGELSTGGPDAENRRRPDLQEKQALRG